MNYPLVETFTPEEARLEIKESVNESGKKVYRCRGRFQMAEQKNRNGRVYPHSILEREVNSLQDQIKERSLFGELDHPLDRINTHLEKAAVVVTCLEMVGNEVIGEYEVLPTDPHGKNLIVMLEHHCRPGVSSRGSGRLVKRGDSFYVSEDYKMKTFDVVSDESTYGAKPTLAEGQVIDCTLINHVLSASSFLDESVRNRINNLVYYGKLDKVVDVLAEEFNLPRNLYLRVANLLEYNKLDKALLIVEDELTDSNPSEDELTPEQRRSVENFILTTPDIDDEKMHAFCAKEAINPHAAETVVYRLTQRLNTTGTSDLTEMSALANRVMRKLKPQIKKEIDKLKRKKKNTNEAYKPKFSAEEMNKALKEAEDVVEEEFIRDYSSFLAK